MTAPVFRLDPLPPGDSVRLQGHEGRHATAVRRLRVGEQIVVTDGRGMAARGTVTAVDRDGLELAVAERFTEPAPSPRLVVVQALVKGERSELAVGLLTEAGVDEIVPWRAERCVAQWTPGRTDRRWRAAADAAAKQSRRVHWPVVTDVVDRAGAAARLAVADLAVVLSETADRPLAAAATGALPPGGEIVLVVGPEGGFTDAETAAFAASGAGTWRLGRTVLRASTAGVVAASVLSAALRWD